jgi:hypothetical protein
MTESYRTVTLTAHEIDRCDKIAWLRQSAAEAHGRVAGNGGASTGPVALRNHILGIRGEHALRNLRRQWKWNWFAEHVHASLPDFVTDTADKVDVKTIEKSHHSMIIQTADDPGWVYFLVDAAHHPTYRIRGWQWGYNMQTPQWWKDPGTGRPAYFYKGPLRSLEEW